QRMLSQNRKALGRMMVLLLMIAIGGWSSEAVAQDFTLGATPLAPSPVNRGSSAVATITVAPLGGFNQAVVLTVNFPAGTTCTFNPASVLPAGNVGTSTLTIATTTSTPDASTLTITGTAAAGSRTTSLSLTAQAAPVIAAGAAAGCTPVHVQTMRA